VCCFLEAVEGGLCLLEVLKVLDVLDVPDVMLYAGYAVGSVTGFSSQPTH